MIPAPTTTKYQKHDPPESVTSIPDGMSGETNTKPSPAHPTRPIRPGVPPASDIKACTMTMNITMSRAPCSNDGTDYIYPSTATVTQLVDCKGCIDVTVRTSPVVFCPAHIISTEMSMTTPKTQWVTACSPTTAYSQLHGGRGIIERDVVTAAACPTTLYVSADQDLGQTSTTYQRVVVSTQRVPCGGCPLVVATRLAGQGPVWRPTATLTSTVGTSTAFQCT
jgi:hypothetical protein